MARREISVGMGETILPNGRKIRTNIIRHNVNVISGDTAKHETDHGLAAEMNGTRVKWMTIIPAPGSLGSTGFEDGVLDPVSAGAAASQNRTGTGWDQYITIATGHDWEASKSAGASLIAKNYDVHDEIAKELEVHKTLASRDIWRVIDRTRNPKAEVTEYGENGREIRSMVQTVRNVDGMVPYVVEEDLADRTN